MFTADAPRSRRRAENHTKMLKCLSPDPCSRITNEQTNYNPFSALSAPQR